jgi:DNA-binding NarL/FixJ family response regulator
MTDPIPADQNEPAQADRPVSEQVAALTASGMTPEQIARRLSLSVTEVSLAMKIQAGRANRLGSKMAAVA